MFWLVLSTWHPAATGYPVSTGATTATVSLKSLLFGSWIAIHFTTCLTLGTEEAYLFGLSTHGMGADLASECNHAILDIIFYVPVKSVWMRAASRFFSMPVSRSELFSGGAFAAGRGNGDLIRYNLTGCDRLRDRFCLRFVCICRDMSAKGDYTLVSILAHGNIFEPCLIERLTDAARHIG